MFGIDDNGIENGSYGFCIDDDDREIENISGIDDKDGIKNVSYIADDDG